MNDDDDEFWNSWPMELNSDSECGEHCQTFTLHVGEEVKRIVERHCSCEWCHGEEG